MIPAGPRVPPLDRQSPEHNEQGSSHDVPEEFAVKESPYRGWCQLPALLDQNPHPKAYLSVSPVHQTSRRNVERLTRRRRYGEEPTPLMIDEPAHDRYRAAVGRLYSWFGILERPAFGYL